MDIAHICAIWYAVEGRIFYEKQNERLIVWCAIKMRLTVRRIFINEFAALFHIFNHTRNKLLLNIGQPRPLVQQLPLFLCQRYRLTIGKELAQSNP